MWDCSERDLKTRATQESPAWLWDDTASAAASPHRGGLKKAPKGPYEAHEQPALRCLVRLPSPTTPDEHRGLPRKRFAREKPWAVLK